MKQENSLVSCVKWVDVDHDHSGFEKTEEGYRVLENVGDH